MTLKNISVKMYLIFGSIYVTFVYKHKHLFIFFNKHISFNVLSFGVIEMCEISRLIYSYIKIIKILFFFLQKIALICTKQFFQTPNLLL